MTNPRLYLDIQRTSLRRKCFRLRVMEADKTEAIAIYFDDLKEAKRTRIMLRKVLTAILRE